MIHLETERLLFRDHEETDLESYCEMETDPVYRSPQPVHPPHELERSFREAWLIPKTMGLWATILKSTNQYIGRCGLYPHRNDDDLIIPGEANIAFYLARPYWGQGLATEAGKAFIDFGFNTLGLSRIEAGINANNQASIRVIQKLGFVWIQSGQGGGNSWHLYELRNKSIQ